MHDDEDVASTFTPSPRPAKVRGSNQPGEMGDREMLLASDDEFDHDNLVETGTAPKVNESFHLNVATSF